MARVLSFPLPLHRPAAPPPPVSGCGGEPSFQCAGSHPHAAPPRLKAALGRDYGDLAARVLVGGLFLALAWRLGTDFLETRRVTGLLMLASELLVAVLTIVRRSAVAIDRSMYARIVTGLSITGPFLVRPAGVGGLWPDATTAMISACGLAIVLWGKMTLGRSFGALPANRGVVVRGPYRLVRHPIYAGYLVNDVGFLIAHPTAWNLVVLGAATIAIVARAVLEERTLARDAEYSGYLARVRWRLIPGLM